LLTGLLAGSAPAPQRGSGRSALAPSADGEAKDRAHRVDGATADQASALHGHG